VKQAQWFPLLLDGKQALSIKRLETLSQLPLSKRHAASVRTDGTSSVD
jgi:hypothetical protein